MESFIMNDNIKCDFFPNKPLTTDRLKYYYEYFSLYTLQYFCSEFNDLLRDDSPDLQTKDHKWGIEVTNVTEKIYQKVSGNFTQYRLTKQSKYIDKITACGASADGCDSVIYPVSDESKEREELEYAIKNKHQKLHIYKDKGFSNIGLIFVYSGISLVSRHWIDVLKNQVNQFNEKFDKYFFLHSCGFESYDFWADKAVYYQLSDAEFNKLSAKARIATDNML